MELFNSEVPLQDYLNIYRSTCSKLFSYYSKVNRVTFRLQFNSPCTSMTIRAPSVVLAILDSLPLTSLTVFSISLLLLSR